VAEPFLTSWGCRNTVAASVGRVKTSIGELLDF
jgi:hypothetical protein